jgi:hypothetical protein
LCGGAQDQKQDRQCEPHLWIRVAEPQKRGSASSPMERVHDTVIKLQ